MEEAPDSGGVMDVEDDEVVQEHARPPASARVHLPQRNAVVVDETSGRHIVFRPEEQYGDLYFDANDAGPKGSGPNLENPDVVWRLVDVDENPNLTWTVIDENGDVVKELQELDVLIYDDDALDKAERDFEACEAAYKKKQQNWLDKGQSQGHKHGHMGMSRTSVKRRESLVADDEPFAVSVVKKQKKQKPKPSAMEDGAIRDTIDLAVGMRVRVNEDSAMYAFLGDSRTGEQFPGLAGERSTGPYLEDVHGIVRDMGRRGAVLGVQFYGPHVEPRLYRISKSHVYACLENEWDPTTEQGVVEILN